MTEGDTEMEEVKLIVSEMEEEKEMVGEGVGEGEGVGLAAISAHTE